MKLKFCDSNEFISIETAFFEENRLYILGNDIPKKEGVDFYIYDGENIVGGCSGYTKIYEKGENFIAYVNGESLFNTFLLYDDEKIVYSQITVVNMPLIDKGYLYKSGYSKECRYPEKLELFDSNNINLYKIEDGKLIETTTEDKEVIAERISAKKKQEELFKLEEAIQKKFDEINIECEKNIIAGIDYNGEHFSYELSDQSNIYNSMQLTKLTGLKAPYHADGESCKLYSYEEIMAIYMLQEMNLTQNTTYANQLKMYVKTLDDMESIEKVEYGTELTGIFLEKYNEIMKHSQELAAVVAKGGTE